MREDRRGTREEGSEGHENAGNRNRPSEAVVPVRQYLVVDGHPSS